MNELERLMQNLCPNGVKFVKIGDVAEVGTGSSNGNEAIDNGEYPFFVRSQTVKAKNEYEYDEEAIIIPGEGGIGEIFHYVNGKYALHQRVYRIHFTTDAINVKFILHYMKAHFKAFILQKAVSSTVTSIRKPMVEGFLIPVPPIEVQDEIVRILDNFTELTAELTAELTTELTARKKQYEYYSSKLFSQGNYDFIPMEELAKFVYGYTDKAQTSGDARFVRITDINDQGYLKAEDKKYITMTDEAKKSLLEKGDIIMARTGATYGKTLYFDSDFPSVYASFLIKIIPCDRLLSKYYWHFTKTPLYWEQANKLVTTGGQPQFNTPALRKIKVPVPPIEEQERIVDILDRFDALCNDISTGLPAEIEARQKQYEYYRDKLLNFKELSV